MSKKLYRSNNDKKLCGVCGGIAEYFGVDSSIVRLICVFLCLTGTIGLWAYIICALVIPQEPDNSVPFQDMNNDGGSYDSRNGFDGGNA